MKHFGQYIRQVREDNGLSLRKVAEMIEITPSLLSKIERGIENASEEVIINLAKQYQLNEDILLAMNGKVSSKLKEIIIARPEIFSKILYELEKQPDHALLRITREVKDGMW